MSIERLRNNDVVHLNHWHRCDDGSFCAHGLGEANSGSLSMKMALEPGERSHQKDAGGTFSERILTASQCNTTRFIPTIPIAHRYVPAVSSLEAY